MPTIQCVCGAWLTQPTVKRPEVRCRKCRTVHRVIAPAKLGGAAHPAAICAAARGEARRAPQADRDGRRRGRERSRGEALREAPEGNCPRGRARPLGESELSPMKKPKTLTIEIRPSARSVTDCDVIWRDDQGQRMVVPMKDETRAAALKALLERGIPAADAVFRAFRPRRRPVIGEKDRTAAKYGRLGAGRHPYGHTA